MKIVVKWENGVIGSMSKQLLLC